MTAPNPFPRADSGWRLVIVGATSLKGKELAQVLEERLFPVEKLHLLDDAEARGRLTEFAGEPAVVESIAPESFAEADLVFFACTTHAFTRAHWAAAAASSAAVIDLSHALLEVPQAKVQVPFLEDPRAGSAGTPPHWFMAPHPAAIVLLALGRRLGARFPLRQMVANVFEPVSERGATGLDELQEQTVQLLSFKDFSREVFDAQVAFNLLPRYGDQSAACLEEVESTIRRQIGRLEPVVAERLALRVIQVPVFHSHSLSVLVELEGPVEVSAVEAVLAGERLRLLGPEDLPTAVVNVAGKDEILVGPVVRDAQRPGAFWLWAVADNLRLIARTAVDIAETLLE